MWSLHVGVPCTVSMPSATDMGSELVLAPMQLVMQKETSSPLVWHLPSHLEATVPAEEHNHGVIGDDHG